MRVEVKKFVFVGLEEEKKAFFESAQQAGLIHFIDVSGAKLPEAPAEAGEYVHAIKILRGVPSEEQVETTTKDLLQVAREIIFLKSELHKLEEQERILNLDLVRVEPFGHFSRDELAELARAGQLRVQFFTARHGIKEVLPDIEGLVYVTSAEGLDYFISFSKIEIDHPKLSEMKFEMSFGEIKAAILQIQAWHRCQEIELKSYARYSNVLHHAFYSEINKVHLDQAEGLTRSPLQGLYTVEGWVPQSQIAEVRTVAEKNAVVMDEVALEANDHLPTYLENEGMGKIGEDLVAIYDTPSGSDKDPSLWVLGAFGVFFAFIVNDGGYGLVYLAICLGLLWKMPHATGLTKRMLHLGIFLSLCCVVWGFIFGQYFGVVLSIDSPFKVIKPDLFLIEKKAQWFMDRREATYLAWIKASPALGKISSAKELLQNSPTIVSTLNDFLLLELAIFFGVAHSLMGMVRYLTRRPSLLGWMFFLVGGYLFFPFYLGTPSFLNYALHIDLATGGIIGLYMIYGGIALAVGIAVYRERWLGLTEFMKVIEVFADVLSYLRLYALGLAGGIVALVINEAAAGMPAIFAALLIFVAHGVNMLLAIMSGVIHGLRLNFIEWYHYSFEGGGKKFRPLTQELYKN